MKFVSEGKRNGSIRLRIQGRISRGKFNDKAVPNSYEFMTASRIDVTLSGPKGALSQLKQDDIKPYIDISNLNQPGIYNVEVSCWVKNNTCQIVKIQPSNIKVKISRK